MKLDSEKLIVSDLDLKHSLDPGQNQPSVVAVEVAAAVVAAVVVLETVISVTVVAFEAAAAESYCCCRLHLQLQLWVLRLLLGGYLWFKHNHILLRR
ncbi:hypothetical protein Patl1_14900 [Pistacia atlantica]|uniref:Uncharacterized protein n=1 Tax=Pistacia atlantica TaxID=434234 RepID=A0ACC1AXH3_9ROSI|nr:hypothetical protein Patl1_14900 [Pistacia atlantica]